MSLRLVKYGIVGLIPFAANFATFALLSHFGISVNFATGVAFFIGGQVAFWSHDRLTFSDRHVSLRGWRRRWRRFMPGQCFGFGLNYAAANLLVEFTMVPDLAVWIAATVAGVVGTFSWTNWFSHKGDKSIDPAYTEPEESQE